MAAGFSHPLTNYGPNGWQISPFNLPRWLCRLREQRLLNRLCNAVIFQQASDDNLSGHLLHGVRVIG